MTRYLAAAALAAIATASCGGHPRPSGPDAPDALIVDVATPAPTLDGIAITAGPLAVAAGTTRPVSVTANYSDLSTTDVTSQVAWQSADPSIASARGGVLTGFMKGETTITASYMGLVASARVQVVDPVLRSIDIAPSIASVALGRTQQFTATGTFSDGSSKEITTLVTWGSSATAIATISNAAGSEGLATTRAVGQTSISADGDRVTGTAMLTVDPVTVPPCCNDDQR